MKPQYAVAEGARPPKVDRRRRDRYIGRMNLIHRLIITFRGRPVGRDGLGNQYFEERHPRPGQRARRWVIYQGGDDASRVPPEWHAWLHHLTDAPLPETARRPWQKPHEPNHTGTLAGYRPPGHDYLGGARAPASADYEAWSPGS